MDRRAVYFTQEEQIIMNDNEQKSDKLGATQLHIIRLGRRAGKKQQIV